MSKFINLTVEDSKDWQYFYSTITEAKVFEEENIQNIKCLINLNNKIDYVLNNYTDLSTSVDFKKYINIDNASLLVKKKIERYLEKFHLEMMIDEIDACLESGSIPSKQVAKYKNLIIVKQEDSIVDLILSENLPSISGTVLASLYMKNIRWGFLNDKIKILMVKKMENWAVTESQEVFDFLSLLDNKEQKLFLKSTTLLDLVWIQGSKDYKDRVRHNDLIFQAYQQDPSRVNDYNLGLCVKSKIYLFYILEKKFIDDGDFQYLQREIDSAPLWINKKELTSDLNSAKNWEDLSLSRESNALVNPTLSFYYLMQKYQPNFVQLMCEKLSKLNGELNNSEHHFALLVGKELDKYKDLDIWNIWPNDMKIVFREVINNNTIIATSTPFKIEHKAISDFLIDSFIDSLHSSRLTIERFNPQIIDSSLKIKGNFYESHFYDSIKILIKIIPILLETENDENKRSTLNFIKFIGDSYSNNKNFMFQNFEKNSHSLAKCKFEHYKFLTDAIDRFLWLEEIEQEIKGFESAFFYQNYDLKDAKKKMENIKVLLDNSILNHIVPINEIKNKINKF